jgi:branched-chain amino acid transport system substrate-binding protein
MSMDDDSFIWAGSVHKVIHRFDPRTGKVDNIDALMRAMRKVTFPSARGPYKYNVNGFPIQNFDKAEVIKGADGKPDIVTRGVVFENYKDAYWEKCPADKRQ